VLQERQVSVAGGWQVLSIAVAELYDPATNSFKQGDGDH
jgi:hypothetical protein